MLLLNPMAQIIQDARYCLITDQTETMTQLFGTPWARLVPIGITLVLVVALGGLLPPPVAARSPRRPEWPSR